MSYISSYHVSSGTSFVEKRKIKMTFPKFYRGGKKISSVVACSFTRYTYTELFQLLTSRIAVFILILHTIGIYHSVFNNTKIA